MGRYATYPEYKNSEVDWLGEIPAHWDVRKLKYVSSVQPSNVDKKAEENELAVFLCNYTDVYNNEEIRSNIDFMRATATQREIDKFLIREGDVIVTKDSESREDIAVPAYVAEDLEDTLCGYHLTHIRPVDVIGKFLFRLFESTRFNGQFVVGANGVTRFGLPQHIIDNAFIALPPLPEQRAIARFLDHKTAQIDALIAKKEALLARLAAKRTALISHAVTKGLDPDAPMQDSGIEWLGEIPSHWRVLQLRRFGGLVQTGPFGSQLHSHEYVEGGFPVVNPANISDGHIVPNLQMTVDDETRKRLSRHVLQVGDIVLGRRGELGRAAYVGKREAGWLCGTGSILIRVSNPLLEPEYLDNYIRLPLIKDYLTVESVGSTMDNLNTDIINRLPVLVPPHTEQAEIVDHCGTVMVDLEYQTTRVQQAIDKLRQYRTALITHAVTGKIDVRTVPIPPLGSDAPFK
ncbi:MAG: restriction endonuclease subunit S [Caldilineaceae bacterium]|nr:restriction endonuclease subunit S [Caldilineaceae bacterium]